MLFIFLSFLPSFADYSPKNPLLWIDESGVYADWQNEILYLKKRKQQLESQGQSLTLSETEGLFVKLEQNSIKAIELYQFTIDFYEAIFRFFPEKIQIESPQTIKAIAYLKTLTSPEQNPNNRLQMKNISPFLQENHLLASQAFELSLFFREMALSFLDLQEKSHVSNFSLVQNVYQAIRQRNSVFSYEKKIQEKFQDSYQKRVSAFFEYYITYQLACKSFQKIAQSPASAELKALIDPEILQSNCDQPAFIYQVKGAAKEALFFTEHIDIWAFFDPLHSNEWSVEYLHQIDQKIEQTEKRFEMHHLSSFLFHQKKETLFSLEPTSPLAQDFYNKAKEDLTLFLDQKIEQETIRKEKTQQAFFEKRAQKHQEQDSWTQFCFQDLDLLCLLFHTKTPQDCIHTQSFWGQPSSRAKAYFPEVTQKKTSLLYPREQYYQQLLKERYDDTKDLIPEAAEDLKKNIAQAREALLEQTQCNWWSDCVKTDQDIDIQKLRETLNASLGSEENSEPTVNLLLTLRILSTSIQTRMVCDVFHRSSFGEIKKKSALIFQCDPEDAIMKYPEKMISPFHAKKLFHPQTHATIALRYEKERLLEKTQLFLKTVFADQTPDEDVLKKLEQKKSYLQLKNSIFQDMTRELNETILEMKERSVPAVQAYYLMYRCHQLLVLCLEDIQLQEKQQKLLLKKITLPRRTWLEFFGFHIREDVMGLEKKIQATQEKKKNLYLKTTQNNPLFVAFLDHLGIQISHNEWQFLNVTDLGFFQMTKEHPAVFLMEKSLEKRAFGIFMERMNQAQADFFQHNEILSPKKIALTTGSIAIGCLWLFKAKKN